MRCACGWTVVELLVALLLGLLIAWMSAGLLLAASTGYRHHSESSALNDSGQLALEVLAQAVRQAGYQDWDHAGAPVVVDAPIVGLDARSLSREAEGVSAPVPAVDGGSDVLAVRFAGSGSGGNGDGSMLNCAGFGVGAPADQGALGWSIFYVALDALGEPELRCKYRGAHGWGSDAIARGVESFQVLYGVDTDAVADGVPNAYLRAAAVSAMGAAYWQRVCSVRVALLLRGAQGSMPDSPPAAFDLFGRAYTNAFGGADPGVRVDEAQMPLALQHRARQVFSATVMLRNRAGAL